MLLGAHGPSAVVRGLVYRDKLNRPPYRTNIESLYWPELARLTTQASASLRPLVRRLARPLNLAQIGLRWLMAARLAPTLGDYDAIWLIKYFSPAFARALRTRTRAKILYDFDDAMWLPEFLGERPFAELVGLVDAVSCDNTYLLERAQRHNRRSFVLRGVARSIELAPRQVKAPDAPVVIGWIGSSSTLHYLEIVRQPLERLAATLPGRACLRIVGTGSRDWTWPSIPGLAIETVATYDEAEMLRQLGEIEIGLFPLHDDENSLGRGILKATIYLGAGIPAVTSGVGELRSLFADRATGVACQHGDDWTAALETLVLDAGLRQRMGQAGRRLVEHEFSLDQCFAVLEREFLDRL